jgi:hypothetical protein
MNLLLQISLAVICLFIVWRIYTVLKANPDLMSRENMSKSFTTFGILALILIGGVALLVMLVKM